MDYNYFPEAGLYADQGIDLGFADWNNPIDLDSAVTNFGFESEKTAVNTAAPLAASELEGFGGFAIENELNDFDKLVDWEGNAVCFDEGMLARYYD